MVGGRLFAPVRGFLRSRRQWHVAPDCAVLGAALWVIAAASWLGLSPAGAFPGRSPSQFDGADGRPALFLLHKARVICRVYTTGNVRHTEFCEDGYTCDLSNRKCNPGPEMLRKQEAERQAQRKEAAHREYKSSAPRRADEARLAASKTTANKASTTSTSNCIFFTAGAYSCTSANWSGNPKEMPSPRYYGSGASTMARAVRAQPIAHRLQENHVPPSAANQIANLLVIWQDLQPNDPNRQTIENQVRELAHCCNIPLDPNEYFGPQKSQKCGIPTIHMKGALDALQLQWAPQDMPQRAIETGTCARGDGLPDCVKAHYGQLVMGVEPTIASFCRLQEINTPAAEYDAKLNTCAQRKFDNAWANLRGLTWMWQSASELDPGRRCSEEKRKKHDRLSQKLKKMLAGSDSPDPVDPTTAKPDPTNNSDDLVEVSEVLPETKPSPADDVLCAYLARWSVRGKLTPGATPELPKECQAAIETAKDCARESCDMAKVIDDEENKTARKTQPWGADDRQDPAELMPSAQKPTP